jgi:hypothetical protein
MIRLLWIIGTALDRDLQVTATEAIAARHEALHA